MGAIIGFGAIICLFAGFARMGFAAGLAWFVIVVLLALLFWPLAVPVTLAILFYGLGGMFRSRRANSHG